MPKFVVSYLKSIYGDAATKENQFGWDWHPKILGDHSHMAMFVAMNAGKVKGMFASGRIRPRRSMPSWSGRGYGSSTGWW